MALTAPEKMEINKVWKVVMKDPKAASLQLFINFFNDFPEYKNLFKKFERISLEDLPKSRQLKAHAVAVINSLNGMIENIDDPECLEELLKQNGKQHAHFGTTMQHYHDLWDTCIKTFKQACGPMFTDNTEKAWKKVFGVMDKFIEEGLVEEGVDD